MSATESSPSTFYQSEYHHGIDEKRRLQVPAKWRPQNPDVEFTLIPWPTGEWKEACLLVLPPQEREALVQKLKAMPYADPKAQTLRRLLASKSDQVTLDKSGRLCLPEAMAKAVGLDKEAVLVGMFDRFEIWSPERYSIASKADAEQSAEAFKLI